MASGMARGPLRRRRRWCHTNMTTSACKLNVIGYTWLIKRCREKSKRHKRCDQIAFWETSDVPLICIFWAVSRIPLKITMPKAYSYRPYDCISSLGMISKKRQVSLQCRHGLMKCQSSKYLRTGTNCKENRKANSLPCCNDACNDGSNATTPWENIEWSCARDDSSTRQKKDCHVLCFFLPVKKDTWGICSSLSVARFVYLAKK